MVVVTDGAASDRVDEIADSMRNTEGIDMIAVGWGGYDINDLKDITGGDMSNIVTATSTSNLMQKITPLIETVCS